MVLKGLPRGGQGSLQALRQDAPGPLECGNKKRMGGLPSPHRWPTQRSYYSQGREEVDTFYFALCVMLLRWGQLPKWLAKNRHLEEYKGAKITKHCKPPRTQLTCQWKERRVHNLSYGKKIGQRFALLSFVFYF